MLVGVFVLCFALLLYDRCKSVPVYWNSCCCLTNEAYSGLFTYLGGALDVSFLRRHFAYILLFFFGIRLWSAAERLRRRWAGRRSYH